MSAVRLSWTYARNVSHPELQFLIQRRVVGSSDWLEIGKVRGDLETFDDTNIPDGQHYEWKVVAQTASGNDQVTSVTCVVHDGEIPSHTGDVDDVGRPLSSQAYRNVHNTSAATPLHDQPLRGGPAAPQSEGPSLPQSTRPKSV